ncbi:MAG: hypothetical protein OXG35_24255 [Acidobacteria bacterium]|nr:hypothetical protein [Acidobacteriota bacterium]
MDEELAVRLDRVERQFTANRIAVVDRIEQVEGGLVELLILLKTGATADQLRGGHTASTSSSSSTTPASTSRLSE